MKQTKQIKNTFKLYAMCIVDYKKHQSDQFCCLYMQNKMLV